MLVADAQKLKPGDVVLVRMRVTRTAAPGTVAHDRGWIDCENISDAALLGDQAVIVSCSDAVTPADIKAWSGGRINDRV
jgi:hypothetical protein